MPLSCAAIFIVPAAASRAAAHARFLQLDIASPFLVPRHSKTIDPGRLGYLLLGLASFEASSPLFSRGLIVERTTMNLFNRSNQKGAPSESAIAVKNHPRIRK